MHVQCVVSVNQQVLLIFGSRLCAFKYIQFRKLDPKLLQFPFTGWGWEFTPPMAHPPFPKEEGRLHSSENFHLQNTSQVSVLTASHSLSNFSRSPLSPETTCHQRILSLCNLNTFLSSSCLLCCIILSCALPLCPTFLFPRTCTLSPCSGVRN